MKYQGDEISLAMMINKIRCVEDMEEFTKLPKEQVDKILKDTPDYLLGIMEKVLRGLLYSMNLEEEKAENAVSKIKERKMGRLFESVTFDFQAARKEFEEKAAKAEADAKARIEAAEEEAETAEKKAEIAARKAEAAEKEAEIVLYAAKMLVGRYSEAEIIKSLQEKFSLSVKEANEKYKKVIG